MLRRIKLDNSTGYLKAWEQLPRVVKDALHRVDPRLKGKRLSIDSNKDGFVCSLSGARYPNQYKQYEPIWSLGFVHDLSERSIEFDLLLFKRLQYIFRHFDDKVVRACLLANRYFLDVKLCVGCYKNLFCLCTKDGHGDIYRPLMQSERHIAISIPAYKSMSNEYEELKYTLIDAGFRHNHLDFDAMFYNGSVFRERQETELYYLLCHWLNNPIEDSFHTENHNVCFGLSTVNRKNQTNLTIEFYPEEFNKLPVNPNNRKQAIYSIKLIRGTQSEVAEQLLKDIKRLYETCFLSEIIIDT